MCAREFKRLNWRLSPGWHGAGSCGFSPAERLLVHRLQVVSLSLLGMPAWLSIFVFTELTFAVVVWELELDRRAWCEAVALVPLKRCYAGILRQHLKTSQHL